jgi:site-specific DNA recombinase
VVNKVEARHVRAIFALYLEQQDLVSVVEELARRGWRSKRWQTRQGQERGGRFFTKSSLRVLLSNVLYAGQVRYRGEVHAGEQPALVDTDSWRQVQALLKENGTGLNEGTRLASGALLAGLLHCGPCGCAMTPAHSSKRGRRYRYYVCTQAQKRGWHTCPSRSVSALSIEKFVLEQVREEDQDPEASALEPWRLVQSRVERVVYDGARHKVTITLQSSNGASAND